MDMKEWAKNEVAIAVKKENSDYGVACYESALKAYNALMEDGHSGFSWNITKRILNTLMDGRPLTPITEDDFIGVEPDEACFNNITNYQCPRMSSLFKHVDEFGNVTYSDVERTICYINGEDIPVHCGLASRMVDKLFPITLPYTPKSNKYKVYMDEFLSDKNNGDYDHQAVLAIDTGEFLREINEFYDLTGNTPVKITEEEYYSRKEKYCGKRN